MICGKRDSTSASTWVGTLDPSGDLILKAVPLTGLWLAVMITAPAAFSCVTP